MNWWGIGFITGFITVTYLGMFYIWLVEKEEEKRKGVSEDGKRLQIRR